MKKISLVFLVINILNYVQPCENQVLFEKSVTPFVLASHFIEETLFEKQHNKKCAFLDRFKSNPKPHEKLALLFLFTNDLKQMFITYNSDDEYIRFVKEFCCPHAQELLNNPQLDIHGILKDSQCPKFCGYLVYELLVDLENNLKKHHIVIDELDILKKKIKNQMHFESLVLGWC